MGDVAEIEQGGAVRMLKDLFAGAAGGIAQVLIGMGFLFSTCVLPSFLSWAMGCCQSTSRALLLRLSFYMLLCFILRGESSGCNIYSKGVDAMLVKGLGHRYTNNG